MSRLIPYSQYQLEMFGQRYGAGAQAIQRTAQRTVTFDAAALSGPNRMTIIDEATPTRRRRSDHDGRHRTKQDIEASLTDLQTTVLAAARMGGIHQVHHHFKTSPQSARVSTTYHLGSADGRDVTTQIRALGRHGLLEGVMYQTWANLD